MKLIDTEAAVLFIGRPREVLYRWAREGRIRRYGSRTQRLWDLSELRAVAHIPGKPLPEPPKPQVRAMIDDVA